LQHIGAVLREEHGGGGFTAAEPTGKADAEHRVTDSLPEGRGAVSQL
jgi:hypothetical protein